MVNVKKCFLSHNHEVTVQSAEIQLIPLSVVHVCRRLVLSWGWIKFDILCEVWRSAEMRRWDQTWAGTGGRERAEPQPGGDSTDPAQCEGYTDTVTSQRHRHMDSHGNIVSRLKSYIQMLIGSWKGPYFENKIILLNSYIDNIVLYLIEIDINLNLNQSIQKDSFGLIWSSQWTVRIKAWGKKWWIWVVIIIQDWQSWS